MSKKNKGVDGYEEVGDIDGEHVLTRRDKNAQRSSENIRAHFDELERRGHWHETIGERTAIEHFHDDDVPGHEHDGYGPMLPEMPDGVARNLAHVLETFLGFEPNDDGELVPRPRPPVPLMRWRLRYYCGHEAERTAHASHTTVHNAFTGTQGPCAECGADPVVIVAARAVGLVDLPKPVRRRRPAPKRAEALRERRDRLAAELAKVDRDLAKTEPDS